MDTLGPGILSFIERLSSLWRLTNCGNCTLGVQCLLYREIVFLLCPLFEVSIIRGSTLECCPACIYVGDVQFIKFVPNSNQKASDTADNSTCVLSFATPLLYRILAGPKHGIESTHGNSFPTIPKCLADTARHPLYNWPNPW